MEIKLCGESINFTLENENNVLQVVESIETWLNSEKQLISELKIDGRKYEIDNRHELQTLTIDSANIIEIEAFSHEEWAISCLIDGKNYVKKYIDALSTDSELFFKEKQEKIDGLRWIIDVILNSCKILVINLDEIYYKETALNEVISAINIIIIGFTSRKHDKKFLTEELKPQMIENLDKLLQIVEKMIEENIDIISNDEKKVRARFISKIKELIELTKIAETKVQEISVNLLSGKDKVAYQEIDKVFNILKNLTTTLSNAELMFGLDFTNFKINDHSAENLNKELLVLLKEINSAFEGKNLVLLSDLLEYELGEKLGIYKDFLNKLLTFYEKID